MFHDLYELFVTSLSQNPAQKRFIPFHLIVDYRLSDLYTTACTYSPLFHSYFPSLIRTLVSNLFYFPNWILSAITSSLLLVVVLYAQQAP